MTEIEIDPATTWVAVNYTCGICAGTGKVLLGTPGTMPTPSRCDSCGGGGIRTAPLTLENLRTFLQQHPDATPAPAAAPVETPAETPVAAPETVPLPTLDAPALNYANPVTGEVGTL